MKNKKYRVLIVSILVIIVILTFSFFIYKAKKETKVINKIETLILNGDYEEAIKSIYESKDSEVLILYKNILEEFLKVKDESNIEKSKEKVNSFKEKYNSNLNNEIFSKLNEDLLDIEKKVKSYYDEIEKEKEKIKTAINEDIDSVKGLIDVFKEKYPNEDISDIENIYNNRLEEKRTEEEANSIDKDSSDDNTDNAAKLGIANTVASKYSSQIVTVVSKGGSYGELVFWEKDDSDNWILVDKVSARLGQNGMKVASKVYEMDKCTPTGIYSLTEAFGINDNPGSGIRYRQLNGTEYWVDDEGSEFYNTMQFGEPNGRWLSAERLIDFQGYYNYAIVIDYNRWPVVPGKSSAIFLHCDTGSYTYGCVAIPQQNLINLLTRLDPEKDPVIIMDFSYEDIYNNY
ncbi:L,D-transpeptidase family protein [Clostridium nigeriense]|uniref:L,D-transpeptidase family protein n=1 Tax=Clostridium nigeriense TaxID=1805470 RepID=UPI003D34E7AE